MRLKTISFEGNLSKPKSLSALPIGDGLSKTFFDEDFQGSSIPMGHLSRFFKQAIRYLYGSLHISSYIIFYGNMSNKENDLRKLTT